MARRYVVGFLLARDGREGPAVVLVRKNRPAWQAGRLNGVGGKIEPGEGPQAAMAREFAEETGCVVPADRWEQMCTIVWPDDAVRLADAEPSSVTFFRHIHQPEDRLADQLPRVTTTTDEPIEIHRLDHLPTEELIPNLAWLLPLAAYTADHYEPFVVAASIAEVR